jgi:hypothetical protein
MKKLTTGKTPNFKKTICKGCNSELIFVPKNSRYPRTFCNPKCKNLFYRNKLSPNRKRYTGISKNWRKYMREYMRKYMQNKRTDEFTC